MSDSNLSQAAITKEAGVLVSLFSRRNPVMAIACDKFEKALTSTDL